MTVQLSMHDVSKLAKKAVANYPHWDRVGGIYGIPSGGIPTAFAIAAARAATYHQVKLLEWSEVQAGPSTLIVDDVVDSGRTLQRLGVPSTDALALYVSPQMASHPRIFYGAVMEDGYVVFPWERSGDQPASGPEDAVRRLLQFIGRDPDEPDLRETPRRVLSLFSELTETRTKGISGTTFAHEGDDLVVVRDLPLQSLCEHHMMVFAGVAHIGYIPAGKILGLSKFARVVASEAAGLTTQERITHNVAKRLIDMTGSESVAVITEATHSCMVLRGAKAFGSSTSSSAMFGQFRAQASLRSEFLSLVRGRV